MSIITLTTDFGTGSPYVAAMKGVILSIDPAASIVDITHDIRPQDIRQAAIVLEDTTPWFPKDTIHVAVVDPGVGSDRAIVYAQIGRQSYVAPDNGLLSRLICATPPSKLIQVSEPEHWLAEVSSTFHGRDIMAPVAARLGLGLDPGQLGPPLVGLTGLEWPVAEQAGSRIKGVVLEVDSFGNLITNITGDMLAGRPTDERVCIVCSIYETWGIYGSYAEQVNGSFIALIGSSDRMELALVGDNAAARLGIQVGTPVTISWD